MDPFSHFLLAYLLGFGVFGAGGLQYVTAAALAGGLPDGDVLLYPLSKRFPLLRHRGISHSIVGVTAIALVGTWLVPHLFAVAFGPGFADGSPLLYWVALEIGGLSHVFLDALDHWSVPIFAPFSKHEYHFDADRIFNLGAMIFTVVAYATMLYERGRSPLWVWEWTAWVLLTLALVYFAVRLTARWRAGVAQRRLGFTDVIPQVNPFVFRLVEERETPAGRTTRYATYHLRRGLLAEPERMTVPAGVVAEGPVRDAADALHRSYAPALAESWVLGETHHFAGVRERPDAFDVHWYSLEMVVFGRAGGVLAHVDKTTGRVVATSVWRAPGWFGA
jgi:membrane-bound metal-dependent hydrolase YbcI (DUF457 family)